jgi:hypothetical protein
MSKTLPIAKLSDIQPNVLTVIYNDERVILDPTKPWAEFQPARLRAETLIDRVTDAHDAMHSCGDAFEFATEVYGK